MKKRTTIITMISVLLSPIFGGIIGRILGGLMGYSHVYFEDGLTYVCTLTWIVASIIYYLEYKD